MTSTLNNKTDSSINTNHKFNNMEEALDYIASKYILTSDFQSLRKLSEKEYCEKLVILTSDIIDRYFNHHEVSYLEQRIKKGVEINEMKQKQVYFLNKDELDHLDVQQDKKKGIKKKRVCIGIAKFYVKIAHLFSAILMTVNPIYLYKDPVTGKSIRKSIYEKHQIPTSVKTKMNWNFCGNRINILNKGQNGQSDEINIQTDICSGSLNSNGVNSLIDEPGMKELQELYYDKYDYSSGKFVGMTEETKKQYQKDVKIFYTAFTGKQEMPPEIKKFSDIRWENTENKKGCQGSNASFKQSYKGSIKEKDKTGKSNLFYQYAKNLQEMIQSAKQGQKELLSVLFYVFQYVIDPYSGEKKVRINPDLKEESLDQIISKTRRQIMEMYVQCEEDYVKGVQLFEAIVESKILETTQKQVNQLEESIAELSAPLE